MSENRNTALGIGVVGAAIGAVAGLLLSSEQNRKKLRNWYDDLVKDSTHAKDRFESTAHQIRKDVTSRLGKSSGINKRGRKSQK